LANYLTFEEHVQLMGPLARFETVLFFQIPAAARAYRGNRAGPSEGVPLLFFKLEKHSTVGAVSKVLKGVGYVRAKFGEASQAIGLGLEAPRAGNGPVVAPRKESDNEGRLAGFEGIVNNANSPLTADQLADTFRAVFDINSASPAGTLGVDGDAARASIRQGGGAHRPLTIRFLRQMARMHGRSLMAKVYAALLGVCSPLPSALRAAVQEAQQELFLINGTQSHHRARGRGFRFGNEVTLVQADFEHTPVPASVPAAAAAAVPVGESGTLTAFVDDGADSGNPMQISEAETPKSNPKTKSHSKEKTHKRELDSEKPHPTSSTKKHKAK
jgi:hypothetical protein